MRPVVPPVGARFDAYRRDAYWDDSTLGDRLVAHALRDPDHIAVVDRLGEMTYAELEDAVGRCATVLRQFGVERGDVVSLQLPNRREFVIVHLAAERIGAVSNPLLTQYRAHELRGMQEKLRSRVSVFPQKLGDHVFGPMWEEVRAATGYPSVLLEVGSADGFWERLAAVDPTTIDDVGRAHGDDVNIVLFTSGTVRAKGVMHTHNTTVYGLREYERWLALDPSMILWMPSPISHATGLQWGVRTAVFVGATLVLQEKWDPQAACELVEATGATHTIGATAFVHDLLRSARHHPGALRSLRYFVCAGAPIPDKIAVTAREELGFEVLRAYGMSEHFISTICHPTDPDDKRLHTDGRCLPGTEIAVFNGSRTRMLGAGEVGELAVRGPGVALGYVDDPVVTVETWDPHGWQFTEDLAAIEDGFVRLLGRKKDLIIRGGLNISAPEIEALLFTHPAVKDVALIGRPDDRLGERICAIAVAEPGHGLTLEDLTQHLVDQGVSKTKLPEMLELREELPKTPSGKVRKNVLRDEGTAALS